MFLSLIKWIFRLVKYFSMLVLSFVGLLMLTNCTMLGLNYASLETENKPIAYPAITATSKAVWEEEKPALKKQFEDVVYGPWPSGLPAELISRRTVIEDYENGLGTLEELVIKLGVGDGARKFRVGLATPNDANAPLIISQTFSDTCAAFMVADMSKLNGDACGEMRLPGIVTRIFGEFIARAPVRQYLDAGYAYASFEAGEVVPDNAIRAVAAMQQLNGGSQTPSSALMAWAYGFSAVIDVLAPDPKIDEDKIAVLGHSRHGKAALVAGAFEPRIAAVLSHQSGYGGAASSRATTGEGINRMLNGASALFFLKGPSYPHWFAPGFQDYAKRVDDIPVDQHQLIALNAPTPVFLGNGRRDVWSDPNSTYRMAEAADRVYELYGLEGLNQQGMGEFNPQADIAFFMRRGGHGTHQSDIDAFLAFLSAHFDSAEYKDASLNAPE